MAKNPGRTSARSIDLSKKKKVAFICSGGAVKAAAFHVGVAMSLEHAGFRFLGGLQGTAEDESLDPSKTIGTYVGSSAGSLITAFLASGGNLRELVGTFQSQPEIDSIPGMRYREMLSPRIQKASDLWGAGNFIYQMLKGRIFQSPFSTHGIVKYLRSHVLKTEKFSELKSELYIVACEVNRSKKVVFGKRFLRTDDPAVEYRDDVGIADACAASMSLPPVYHPFTIQMDGRNRDFFDGEIIEPLSTHIGRDAGCDLVICSYTHQPLLLPRETSRSIIDRGVEAITLQAIYQSIEQKIQAARQGRRKEYELKDLLRNYFKEKSIDMSLCDELWDRIETRLKYYSHVDYVYIHPRPTDYEMFIAPHFSLNRTHTEAIVRKGYVAARLSLRDQNWI